MLLAGGVLFSSAQDENIIIKNRNSSFYDNPIGRIYTGKSPFNNQPIEVAPAPKIVPAPKPAPAPRPAPAPAPQVGETCAYLVNLVKRAPSMVSVGDQFSYELNVTAQCDVADVTMVDTVPAGASYVSSDPAATAAGNTLTWKFPALNRGESKAIKVTVKAEKEGELVNCATISAIPRVCVSTMVGKAQLAIQKTGPETAQLGQDVTYNVVVSNTGNTAAKDVVVTDAVPDGLKAASGETTLTFPVGELAPGASKTIQVTLKAEKRGRFCNKASANSSNAGKVDAEACTLVVQPGLKIVKTGDAQQYINHKANYKIVVSNTGDTTLTGVVVTDTPAGETSIVAADGATVSGNTATWNIGDLKAGEEKTFTLVLTSKTAGNFCNNVGVSTTQGLRETSQACTIWKGIGALLLEKADDPDPIQIDEITTYTVRVTNQGTADDTNVKMTVEFPEEITPVSADNNGAVEGKKVTFPPFPRLAPKQAFEYHIKAKGVKAGDARVKFIRTSDEIPATTTAEESTRVY